VLFLQLLVLVEEMLALGPGVLEVTHPGGAPLFGQRSGGGHLFGQRLLLAPGLLQLFRGGQPGQPRGQASQGPAQFLELALPGLAVGVGLGHPVERLPLGAQCRQRSQSERQRLEPDPGLVGLDELTVQSLEPLARRLDLVLGQAEIALQTLDPLLQLLHHGPVRLDLLPLALIGGEARPGLLLALTCRRHPAYGHVLRGVELRRIGQSTLQRLQAAAQGGALIAQAILRGAEFFVSQHPGQELGPFGGLHRGHHRQLLLAGEVGVEEFLLRHAEQPADPAGDALQAAGDRRRIPVLVELGTAQRPFDPVVAHAEAKLEFDLHRGARFSAPAPDRVTVAAGRGCAIHRPGNGLEQGGLPRPVRADDAGQPRSEGQVGVLVLPEVLEPESFDLHQASSASCSTA
jgi:hypothetical protein